jgi:hypothetical protein
VALTNVRTLEWNVFGQEKVVALQALRLFKNAGKFTVGFYRGGDLARSSLIGECVVEAIDIHSAKIAALTQLTPQHSEVIDGRYWHAEGTTLGNPVLGAQSCEGARETIAEKP